MSRNNQCRVCLVDGAKYPIFDDIESKDSVYSKLFQCVDEQIQNIEGYPDMICEPCRTTLDTVYKFIKQYQTSCNLLRSGLTVVKKEINYDNEIKDEENEIDICKNEIFSDSDGLDANGELWEPEPVQRSKKENKLFGIKQKLKCLKDLDVKMNIVQKSKQKTIKLVRSKRKNGVDIKSLKNKPSKNVKDKPQEEAKKPALPQEVQRTTLCDICGMVVKKGGKQLWLHRQKHLREEHSCPVCKKLFATQSYMKRHLSSFHGEKSYFCETCGKGYTTKGLLRQHFKNIHVGRKQHACDKCDKVFLYAKGLIIHERAEHLKVKPEGCDICGARFLHEDYLREHMRLHTGETPFKCPVCDRGYAQRCNMKSHIKHNHKLTDLTPEIKKTLKPELVEE